MADEDRWFGMTAAELNDLGRRLCTRYVPLIGRVVLPSELIRKHKGIERAP